MNGAQLTRQINVYRNRKSKKWSYKEQLGRVLWGFAVPFFRFSPRIFWGWRRQMLRLFGARIGKQVHIYPSVNILIPWNLTLKDSSAIGDRVILYALGPINIGARATISQGAHLCAGTHDISVPERTLLKSPIFIGDDAWVCADAFVGPGVVVGEGAIVGARAVAVKNVPANTIVAGNPARQIRST